MAYYEDPNQDPYANGTFEGGHDDQRQCPFFDDERVLGTVIASGFGITNPQDGKDPKRYIAIQVRTEKGNLRWTGWITQNGWQYTEKGLRACGWDVDERNFAFEELNDEQSPILGAEVEVTVKVTVHEGKTRWEAAWLNSPNGNLKRLTPEEARAFGDSLRRAFQTGQLATSKGSIPGVTGYRPSGAQRQPQRAPPPQQRPQQQRSTNPNEGWRPPSDRGPARPPPQGHYEDQELPLEDGAEQHPDHPRGAAVRFDDIPF